MVTLAEIEAAQTFVYQVMQPTPQTHYPLLSQRAGCTVIVKHENHTPLGAFKVRGGVVYMDWLRRAHPQVTGVVTATRGNHGQSIAFAAARAGLKATIFVPHGNSKEKNAAMRALGGELIEAGDDFQDAREAAMRCAAEEGLHMLPSFSPLLVQGVGTYALELFRAHPDLDAVYAPIGMGSGICGLISARDGLGLKTEVVGVVAEGAPAYALSFAAGKPIETATVTTFADGVATRKPDPSAFEVIHRGAARIVQVSDDEIRAAMRHYYTDAHNLAEGAGAVALAGLLHERERQHGKKAAVVLTGSNVDLDVYLDIMAAQATPTAAAA
jgi:threonine dehydratase